MEVATWSLDEPMSQNGGRLILSFSAPLRFFHGVQKKSVRAAAKFLDYSTQAVGDGQCLVALNQTLELLRQVYPVQLCGILSDFGLYKDVEAGRPLVVHQDA